MKRKLLYTLLVIVAINCFVLGLIGCDNQHSDEHNKHLYASEWSYDDVYHWHNPICDDLDPSSIYSQADRSEHSFIDGVCEVCGYDYPYR